MHPSANPPPAVLAADPLPPLAGADALTDYENGSPALALAIANALVRDWCGWHIAPTLTETLVVDGSGATVQMVPTLHLLDVHAITENGRPVDLTRIAWSQAGYLRRKNAWTSRERGMRVELTHGWPTVPPVVTAVVLGIAKRAKDTPASAVRARTAGPFSEQLTVAADGSIGGVALTEVEQHLLARYRVVPVA
ncbi:hypothetical protein [Nocardia altamirensis]|uniref:hypothetical protein n=1 Tax=Nocardia altamirensis TaxID=472158 RepID=UPI0008401D03|nr:hypothetical protein [Nocardia altamirensis]